MSEPTKMDGFKRAEIVLKNLSKPFQEIYTGIRTGSLPWLRCLCAAFLVQISFFLRLDFLLFQHLDLQRIYPRAQWLYSAYYFFWIISPFIAWGAYRSFIASGLKRRLAEIFRSIGLQNRLGRLPNLIYDIPLDDSTRKLRLSRATLPLSEFQRAKSSLESALHVFVDEIREDRIKGAVDIIYSHTAMPDSFMVKEYKNYHRSEYTIGTTRSKVVRSTLQDVPHLLVAGQTGGGKSTFLRHFICSLYSSDKKAKFTLIDLKGGLEFQIFEKLPRITVSGDMGGAVVLLKEIDSMVKRRFKLLKDNKCKDIAQYLQKPGATPIVVDEAAEMFLTNALASATDVRAAKEIMSRIARLGRSLGIHLVIATQRPDSRALDPQIKANLTGVLCFQMVNDISSITVLGNGRATDLPPIPGRAIWKSSMEMREVQTPLLTTERTEELLASEKETNQESAAEDPHLESPSSAPSSELSVDSDS